METMPLGTWEACQGVGVLIQVSGHASSCHGTTFENLRHVHLVLARKSLPHFAFLLVFSRVSLHALGVAASMG